MVAKIWSAKVAELIPKLNWMVEGIFIIVLERSIIPSTLPIQYSTDTIFPRRNGETL